MPKDSFFFKHDLNARHNKKMAALTRDFRSAGSGIYWAFVETIYEEEGSVPDEDLSFYVVAKALNEETEFVKEVIQNCITKYELFVLSEGRISSERATEALNERLALSEIRAKAGGTRAKAQQKLSKSSAKAKKPEKNEQTGTDVQQNGTHAEHMLSKCSANAQQMLSKKELLVSEEKRREEKNINTVRDIKAPDENFDDGLQKPQNFDPGSRPGVEHFVEHPSQDNQIPNGVPKVIDDIEQELLNDPVQFELLCLKARVDKSLAKEILHRCHLWYENHEKYPVSKRAGYAQVETFFLNKQFHPNETDRSVSTSGNGKLGTSKKRLNTARHW